MSWNIYIYAEVKDHNDTEWKPLTKNCVCDNFKYYDNNFCRELATMEASNTSIESLKNINSNDNFTVSYCTLEEFRDYYNSIIKTFETELKSVYKALDVNSMYLDDEDYWESDEDTEDDIKDEENNSINNLWIKRMTLPVNKKLFTDLANSLSSYRKALEMIGLCNTLSNICDHYDDKIRLVFATM